MTVLLFGMLLVLMFFLVLVFFVLLLFLLILLLFLDVVFQANIELSGTYVFRREVQVACTQRVQMLDEVE